MLEAFRIFAAWQPMVLALPVIAAAWFWLTRIDRPEDEPWAKPRRRTGRSPKG
jgi:hypothetical protein